MSTDVTQVRPASSVGRLFADPRRLLVGLALASVYFFGGTNYIAVAFSLDAYPPFAMLAMRFLGAGILLTALTVAFARSTLTLRTAANAALVGLLLIGGTFAGISFAQQSLDAGLVAAMIATAPLWAAVIAAFLGRPPALMEWIGIAFGIGGLALLASDGSIQATPQGAFFAVAGAGSLAVGSMLAQRLKMPRPLPSSAVQMLTVGIVFLALSLGTGEIWPTDVDVTHWLTIAYQAVFCSAVAFGMYNYLLTQVRVSVAMSFAYVNPVVAVILGAILLAEPVTPLRGIAIAVTLLGVVIITTARRPATA